MIFEIYTKPIPKGRPRLGKCGAYTPPQTKFFENFVAINLRKQMMLNKHRILTDLVCVSVIFDFKRSKSSMLLTPRPDVDNLLKSILDAMNGIVVVDDKNIYRVIGEKRWSDKDKITIEVAAAGKAGIEPTTASAL